MKKILITIATILFSSLAQAQVNYIISTLYEPDSCFTLDYHWTKDYDNAYAFSDTVKIDINQDGIGDVFVFLEPHPIGGYMSYVGTAPKWQLYGPISDTTNINEALYWRNKLNLSVLAGFNQFAFRHQSDDGIHYGWASIENTAHCVNCICCFGYCTLPDTPIHWGQTSMIGVDENESNAFATLHPNPTTGMVTVTGENLCQAEVFNVLGQQVLTATGKGNEIYIDMADLPAGIYFVAITNEEWQKCVRKVVKE